MNQSRLLPLVILLVGLVVTVIAVIPLPTAGFNSVSEALLRTLHRRLLLVAVPLALLVEGLLFYAAIKFHGNDDPKPTEERQTFEITWTVVVALILLFVGASSYLVLGDPMVSTGPDVTNSPRTVNVHVTGQNWFWEFTYPDEGVTTTNTLVLPSNRTILFRVTSKDVIHSVHIPALGVKQDAIPGRTNTFKTNGTKTGTYRLYCAEFCGTGHSKMLATVEVVSPGEYRRWLHQQKHT
ncbi:cytochrome c oxidase subunit II [Halocatena salina]|uniref:cytochrome-c oxidase n=1 Tax=Halocatena salina TaxID=2934340 RepID=A0A8U0A8K3_9EURY|nr:cytochrome c oxidase subunit II [Halocatena salina]UPM45166.1 cytochrome c oxidase subunit II [Halocatena salina]